MGRFPKTSHIWAPLPSYTFILDPRRHGRFWGFAPSASPSSGPRSRPQYRTSKLSPGSSLTATTLFGRQRVRPWASTARPWGVATVRVHKVGDHTETSVYERWKCKYNEERPKVCRHFHSILDLRCRTQIPLQHPEFAYLIHSDASFFLNWFIFEALVRL